MSVKVVRSLLVTAAVLLISAAVFAHHGTFVSYDSENCRAAQ